MSAFWSGTQRKNGGNSREESRAVIDDYRRQISEGENIIYGLALYFEAINLFHEGSPIVETYKKQFRNIIRGGRELLDKASRLLSDVESGAASLQELNAFDLDFLNGHPNADENRTRALLFYEAYTKHFSQRPRDKDLTQAEMFVVFEEAVRNFGKEQLSAQGSGG